MNHCDYFDYWGKGTKVAVTSEAAKGPDFLYALQPCNPSSSAGLISLGCVAGGFSPEDFSSFSWKGSSGNQLSDIYQYSKVKNNGVSMVVSEIRVNAADWGGQTYYECAARHQSTGKNLSERIDKPVPPKPPTVSLVTLPIWESRVDALLCVIQDFYPKSVSVTWKAGGRTVSGQTWQSEKGQTKRYSASSLLKLNSSVWESNTVYTCEVQHGDDKITKTISKVLSSRSSLDVTLKPPRVKEMFTENRAVLECIITGEDEAVKEAEVTWMLDNEPITDTSKIKNTDHSLRRNSILTLAVKDWEGVKTVKCSVQKKGGPTTTKILRFGQKGSITPPAVSIQTPSPKDLDRKSEFFLLCLVTGFNPEEIYIMWQVNETQYEEGVTGELQKTGDKYSVTSLFRVSKVDWDNGNRYSCSAIHASQERKQIPAVNPVSKLIDLSSRSCLDVTLKPPRVKEMFTENRAVLECIITGEDEAVKEAVVTWMLDDVPITDTSKIKNTDHSLRRNSILTLAVKDWEGVKTVKCSVQKKGGPTTTKILRFGQKGSITPPAVSIQTPSPKDLDRKSEFFLLCLVTGFNPEEIYIMWQVNEKQYEEGITGELQKTGDKYSVTSLFRVSKVDWDNGNRYSCSAIHASQERKQIPAVNPVSKLTVLSSRPCLDVTLKPPRVKEMFIDNRAVLECIITGEDEAVNEAEVTWMLDNEPITDTSKIKNTDHLFRRNCTLTLGANDWEGGKTVKCSVQQKGGPTITKTLSLAQKGLMTSPTVSIQTPSPEDRNGKIEFFLLCLVTGFYPKEIYITWQVNGTQYEEGITGEPVQTGDTYSVTSLFRVSKEDWDKGTKYNCNARHASQERKQIPALNPVHKLKVSPPEQESPPDPALSCNEGGEEEDEFSSLWSTAFSFIILFLFSLVYSAFLSLIKAKQ
ncbi:uncharacterized protein [Paramormyrops kingsleyae]|uniref:uncharacterized protein n=1 Tax=Paramormyrops kingsleyae TaxID=1676925 RepID=UPI003B97C9F9